MPRVHVEGVDSAIGKKLVRLILMKIFRPDKFTPVGYHLVRTVLGD